MSGPPDPLPHPPSADPEAPIALGYETPEQFATGPQIYVPNALLRILWVLGGVLYPILGLVLGGQETAVEWQNGQPWAWVTLLAIPPALLPLLPQLLLGWAALLAVLAVPEVLRSRWIVAFLSLGIVNGVLFLIIVAAGGADGNVAALDYGVLMQLGALVGAAFLYGMATWIDRARLLRRMNSAVVGVVVCTVVGVALLGVAAVGPGLIAIPLFATFFAAPISIAAFSAALLGRWLAIKSDPAVVPDDVRSQGVLFAVFGALLLLFAIAVAMARHLALRHYNTLPTQPPGDCFVATAASKSARSAATGHRQLATLQRFESRLLQQRPSLHRRIRRVYNVIGPIAAGAIDRPARADAAHRLLRPVEWLARRLEG